jgi:hypothetical protein
MSEPSAVLRFGDINPAELTTLLASFQLEIFVTGEAEEIPGSYWGDEEAGLIKGRLYLRADIPVHSILHEACHYICMDSERRGDLDTNAGADDDEENAVCYLQLLLARNLSSISDGRLFSDMDAWGYSFRLGSTQAWFEQDADDARSWLLKNGLIDSNNQPEWRLR